jgi:hypothetical protein
MVSIRRAEGWEELLMEKGELCDIVSRFLLVLNALKLTILALQYCE